MRMIPTMMMCVRYIASPMHRSEACLSMALALETKPQHSTTQMTDNAYFVPTGL